MSQPVETAVSELLAEIESQGCHLAVAESLTGGLLAAAITSVSGSSRVFLGGVVAYQSATKVGLVGVSAPTLSKHGAVSAAVAGELAAGACRALAEANQLSFESVIGIGTTGVAGPDLQEGKPVGTVYVAVAIGSNKPAVRELLLTGNRAEIRAETVRQAIDLAREQIVALRR